jgi:hypothetical protein
MDHGLRFSFQKNIKINPYKYPIKNQEDEVIIQLDEINQKPVLSLLKENGINGFRNSSKLTICRLFLFLINLWSLNSKQLEQPISRFRIQF